MRERQRAAVAEGQRRRIIALLEHLAEVEPKEQCDRCGQWFDRVASHRPNCDGPE